MSTYYIDATLGSDAAAGTQAAPWQTVAKVNQTTLNPGDTVYFKRGEVWREKLRLMLAGTESSPITFSAYGTGDLPIISGADVLSSWTVDGSDYYASVASLATWIESYLPAYKVPQVFYDDARLILVADRVDLDAGKCWYDEATDRVYIRDNPAGHTVEITARAESMFFNFCKYLTFEYISFQKSMECCNFWGGIKDIDFGHCEIKHVLDRGFYGGWSEYQSGIANAFTADNGDVIDAVIDPYGGDNATEFVADGTNDTHGGHTSFYGESFAGNKNYIFSVFAKSGVDKDDVALDWVLLIIHFMDYNGVSKKWSGGYINVSTGAIGTMSDATGYAASTTVNGFRQVGICALAPNEVDLAGTQIAIYPCLADEDDTFEGNSSKVSGTYYCAWVEQGMTPSTHIYGDYSEDVEFHHNTTSDVGVDTKGGDMELACGTTNFHIHHNTLQGDASSDDVAGVDGIVMEYSGGGHIIEYNTIRNHYQEDGIDLKVTYARFMTSRTYTVIRYNLIYGHRASCGAIPGYTIDNTGSGITVHFGARDVKVYGNIVTDNIYGIWCATQGLGSTQNVHIYNNLIYENDLFGIEASQGFVQDLFIYGNVIAMNGGDGATPDDDLKTGIVLSAGTGIVVKNNIFYDNCPASLGDKSQFKSTVATTDTTLDYNAYCVLSGTMKCAYDGSDKTFGQLQAAGIEAHGFESDPRFVSYAYKDFHLQATSPCIDAGANLGEPYNLDFNEDDQDDYGDAWDIGAFVYPAVTGGADKFMLIPREFWRDYTPTASHEDSSYPDDNLIEYARPIKRWQYDSSTPEITIILDLGFKLAVTGIYVGEINFTSLLIAANDSDSWGSPSWSETEFTIAKDPRTQRYKGFFELESCMYRYIRLRILPQTPVDGADVFKIGTVVLARTNVLLPINPRYDYDMTAQKPSRQVEYETGPRDHHVLGMLKRFEASFSFEGERSNEAAFWDKYNLGDPGAMFLFYENGWQGGGSESAWLMRMDGKIKVTCKGYEWFESETLEYREVT
jgi:hypothetical protein